VFVFFGADPTITQIKIQISELGHKATETRPHIFSQNTRAKKNPPKGGFFVPE